MNLGFFCKICHLAYIKISFQCYNFSYGQKPKGVFMKVIKVLLFLIITLVCFAGCGSMATAPYSFTENDNGTAEITFKTNLNKSGGATGFGLGGDKSKKSIQLISIEEDEIPLPERRQVWNPVSLPAETPLTLNVNIFYYYKPNKKGASLSTGSLADVILAPVIIAAEIASEVSAQVYNEKARGWRNMDVVFNCPPLEAGKNYRLEYVEKWFQKSRLVLTEISTKKVVYEQEVNENWQVGGIGNWQGEKENLQSKAKKGK
jgi:hypothetical protein